MVSDSNLVRELEVLILIVILFFFLLNVPHTLVYIANHRSQVFHGYLLRYTSQLRISEPSSGMTPQSTEKEEAQVFSVSASGPVTAPKQPWHFPIYLSRRHPVVDFMEYRIIGNYTLVQILLMAGYSAAIFCAAFYVSNPFSNPKRSGWVIISQIPLVYALATKNNIIGLLAGAGYERLNYLHRHVGRLIVVGANVHAIGYTYKWTLAGRFLKNISRPNILYGAVALLCFDLLGFLSVRSVRNRFYNLFFGTHVVASIAALVAAFYHQPACIPYVIFGSVIYGLDHTIRAIRTRFTIATLQTVPELELTQINIPSLNTGWRTGQHVRLRVFSPAIGLWRMTEVHPFTIASATGTEDGLVLMCKKTGKWTRKLYEMAQKTVTSEQGEARVHVIVEGPYGGVGDTTIYNYSGAMFVVGGSGVTFALSAVQELALAGVRSRTQVIELIWIIPNPAALKNFVPLFTTLAAQSSPATFRVSVFYTRVTSRSPEEFLLPPGITLTPGRPRTEELLREFVTSVMNKGGTHGAFVGVCGPVSLTKNVACCVRTFDARSKKAVGGIHMHEECFFF